MQTDTLNLVGQIYDAVSEPDRWNTLLANLARVMGAHAVRMRMGVNTTSRYNLIAGTGHDSQFDEKYVRHFHKVDVFNPVFSRGSPGQLIRSDAVLPLSLLRNTEIYNDLYREYDAIYGLGSNIIRGDNMIARIGIHRSHSQGPFGEPEHQLLQELMPHLQRAFKLGRHISSLQDQLTGMQEALYRSSTAQILIDEYGQVAFVNQRAEELLGVINGLSITSNRLKVFCASQQAQLNALIAEAVATGNRKGIGSGGAMRLSSADGRQRYNLFITPYPDKSVSQLGINRRICASLFLHDSLHASRLPADAMKTLYGLTRSEIRLAEALVEGLTPAEAATRFCVSVNTVRTQVRALFAKTDTSRQAELVKLLITLTGVSS